MAGKKPAGGVELDVKPTSQLDLQRRLEDEKDNPPPVFMASVNPVDSVLTGEDDDGNVYYGTDPIYQNRANETDLPHAAEEGPDKLAEDAYLDSLEGGNEATDQLKEIYGGLAVNTEGQTDAAAEAQPASGESASSDVSTPSQ